MGHVRLDQVAGSQSTAQRQLTGEDGSTDDACQASRVVAGVGRVGATDTQHVEHGTLRLQDGSSAKSAHLDRWHGDGNLERSTEAGKIVSVLSRF